MSRGKQISATIEPSLYDEIDKMATKERRSVSEMAAILLENAVKERNRKKKGKENN
jgi:hypothetical protein